MKTITRAFALVAALVLALGLAACGDDEDSASSTGAATSESAATASFPVSVKHKFGTTEVPSEPKRVVVVGYTELDAVLALGVTPVGTRDFLGGYDWRKRPWAKDFPTDIPSIGGQEINYESVAARRPDLIIALNTGMQKADYERLSKIAPTIAQSGDFIDFGMPWDAQLKLIAKALGRDQRADEVITEVKAKFAAAREEHPEFEGKDAILAYGGPDGYGAYASADTRSRFFADLGLKTPAKVDELAGKSFYTEFSQEQFRLMDQDLVVMFGPEKDIEANKVMRRLQALKDDRIVYLDLGDQFSGALGYSSPLSLPWLLDNELDTLQAAIDGDPATKVVQPQ
ncbi:iron-siderophore ABC transporter substrate-binding protein [Conexibacter sp. SYSU D00693]|uniref:iron-siderophore ABC transporter substrate-binding protein n=1 Tax=Conexibacter sp. SYSU D00693 TaxID=2812560 RepID=UPI00196A4BE0|nr:iron-siderophore ABC transporter substrate-binding protein [Conexibacter sp. SYSU D00693]